ncbi:hypothetical protein CEXT_783011 [Caerostris extrusa]|uniref:Uncharacterized protein n=1 Tax=Caerostris extrusa TaxID=172846 RepID=A0AAV4R3W6_CAEEX|nr:hypothetical protein CEXT_783011 [Caerostris extrusa]
MTSPSWPRSISENFECDLAGSIFVRVHPKNSFTVETAFKITFHREFLLFMSTFQNGIDVDEGLRRLNPSEGHPLNASVNRLPAQEISVHPRVSEAMAPERTFSGIVDSVFHARRKLESVALPK